VLHNVDFEQQKSIFKRLLYVGIVTSNQQLDNHYVKWLNVYLISIEKMQSHYFLFYLKGILYYLTQSVENGIILL